MKSSDLKRMNKPIKKARSELGTALELIVRKRMVYKLLNNMDNTAHTLHNKVIETMEYVQ